MEILKVMAAVSVGLAAAAHATAKDVRNPLYDLDPSEKGICTGDPSGPGKDNLAVPDHPVVDRHKIIQELLNRYQVEFIYDEEAKNRSFNTMLLNSIAPCHDRPEECIATGTAAPKPRTSQSTGSKPEPYSPEQWVTKRAGSNALAFRRALLRLFEAAETGRTNGFVVIADNKWAPISIKRTGSEPLTASPVSYRPLVEEMAYEVVDDVVIGRFIRGESAFTVYCARDQEERDALLNLSIQYHAADSSEVQGRREVAMAPAVPLDKLGQLPVWLSEERDLKMFKTGSSELPEEGNADTSEDDEDNLPKGQLLIRKAPDEFPKSSGRAKAASLGRTFRGGDVELAADAAIGYQIAWKGEKVINNGGPESERLSWKQSITPYIAIAQAPVEDKRPKVPTPDDPSNTETVQIAYADLTAGIRWDFDVEKRLHPGRWTRQGVSPKDIRPRPQHEGALIFEIFTDNYLEMQATRIGLEYSLWDWADAPGYTSPYALDRTDRRYFVGKDRKAKDFEVYHWLTGLSVEFDFDVAIDNLNYTGQPIDYGSLDPSARKENSSFLLYGANLEGELRKRNLFGPVSESGWFSLGVDYKFREGFESGTPTTHEITLATKLSHPELSGLEFGLEYSTGQDFKTQQDINILAFTLGAKY